MKQQVEIYKKENPNVVNQILDLYNKIDVKMRIDKQLNETLSQKLKLDENDRTYGIGIIAYGEDFLTDLKSAVDGVRTERTRQLEEQTDIYGFEVPDDIVNAPDFAETLGRLVQAAKQTRQNRLQEAQEKNPHFQTEDGGLVVDAPDFDDRFAILVQAAEQAAEQARRAAEQAAEQTRQAAEQTRRAAKQAAEQIKRDCTEGDYPEGDYPEDCVESYFKAELQPNDETVVGNKTVVDFIARQKTVMESAKKFLKAHPKKEPVLKEACIEGLNQFKTKKPNTVAYLSRANACCHHDLAVPKQGTGFKTVCPGNTFVYGIGTLGAAELLRQRYKLASSRARAAETTALVLAGVGLAAKGAHQFWTGQASVLDPADLHILLPAESSTSPTP
jgi:hypothetical protein